jgi:hypothetical protein
VSVCNGRQNAGGPGAECKLANMVMAKRARELALSGNSHEREEAR